MDACRYTIVKLTGAIALLWLLVPTGASALGGQVTHLGGDQYRVSAWEAGNLGITAKLQHSGQTHQTMNFQLVVTQNPNYHGQAYGQANAAIDITVPADVEEVCVRCGAESLKLDLRKQLLESATSDMIQQAIDHGEAIEFSYQNGRLVAWPRLLYRVSGDTHGQIVQCLAQTKGDSQGTHYFYIRSISNVTVKNASRLTHF